MLHALGENKDFKICIVGGCGHVGLPLGIAFADRGLAVSLFDINKSAVEHVNSGRMLFKEEGAEELLLKAVKEERLSATVDPSVIARAEVIVLIIGTPVDEHLNPRLQDVFRAVDEIKDHLDDDQLLILRSTLYPGVSERIRRYLAESGHDLDVAFCPERIAEGHALTEFYTLPQIVAGCSPRAFDRAAALFSLMSPCIKELTPLEAELAKLFTNTWRYINFAIANQFYMSANSQGLDFYRIREAMVADYPRL